eukprot:TRINITY_DN8294_c0_g5_i1.p1 TRINITY_DN8294_c0_g5~~TRINITY_DN8294_c0_g5_i1.p1  ORF type:complete len:400 (+),score=69.89 TRINITY_DN8294_c0_g5_i1:315-1514(+)
MVASDFVAGVLLVFFSAIAASSGTGGGGLLVALFISLENFTPSQSIPLSKASILGSAIANALYNFFQRHPRANRPLIDFNLVGYLEPPVLLGTVIGVYLVKFLPSVVVLGLLVLLLGYTAYRTILKGITISKQEAASKSLPEQTEFLSENSVQMDPELQKILDYDKHVPWLKLSSFLLIWASVFVVAFLKGGEGHSSPVGIKCGSIGYWLLVSSLLPVVVIFLSIFGMFIKREHEKKISLNYPFLDCDILWKTELLVRLPFYCVVAGIAAGLFGIGSGMIIGPILLTMNVHPRVSAAVSSFMILFTASSTTLQFAILGMLEYDYALYFSILGFFGALIGQFGVSWLLKKYNKSSLVVFLLAFIIIIGAVALLVLGVLRAIDRYRRGISIWHLTSVCPTH